MNEQTLDEIMVEFGYAYDPDHDWYYKGDPENPTLKIDAQAVILCYDSGKLEPLLRDVEKIDWEEVRQRNQE